MKTETLFKGCLVMKEDQNGFWHFLNYRDRKPLSKEEIDVIEKMNTKMILISYPTPNEN